MTTTKNLNVPIGSIVSILLFVWTLERGTWSQLNFASSVLLGLALVFLFLGGDMRYTWVTDT